MSGCRPQTDERRHRPLPPGWLPETTSATLTLTAALVPKSQLTDGDVVPAAQ
jgi:hypothetical protein